MLIPSTLSVGESTGAEVSGISGLTSASGTSAPFSSTAGAPTSSVSTSLSMS